MHRMNLVMVASIAVALMGAAARADTIKPTSNGSAFQSNDSLAWVVLGNNVSVANGTVADSVSGIGVTIDFALGGPGSTMVECPASGLHLNWQFLTYPNAVDNRQHHHW
jgi:hypothetical protein